MKIYIAHHCPWPIFSNNIFQPVHVGAAISKESLGIITDNTGDNISHRNPDFCELTLLYWMWKNDTTSQILGLNHYRRYFDITLNGWKRFWIRNILHRDPYKISKDLYNLGEQLPKTDFVKILANHDIVLAKIVRVKKTLNSYYDSSHIEALRDAVGKQGDNYLAVFDRVMQGYEYAPKNMFVARRDFVQQYSVWLFTILRDTEEQLQHSSTPAPARLYGFFAEQLLYIYALSHNLKIKHLPVIALED